MRLLVLFDICPPQYYGDLHTLLASPAGCAVKYTYRHRWCSPAAADAITRNTVPLDVLTVYVQDGGYVRGEQVPLAGSPGAGAIFIATRFAKLAQRDQGASHHEFWMHVRGYPNPRSRFVIDALAQLTATEQGPYDHLVGLVETASEPIAQELDSLDPWKDIVDVLGQPPSQFSQDGFWRMTSLQNSAGEMVPIAPFEAATSLRSGGTHAASTRVSVEDHAQYILCIEAYTAPGAHHAAPFSIEFSSSHDAAKVLEHSPIILRRYERRSVPIECDSILSLRAKEIEIRLKSPEINGFPSGPELRLQLSVKKGWRKLVFGGLTLGVAAILGSIAVVAPSVTGTAVAAALAFIAGVAGTLILFGRLTRAVD